MKNTIVIIIVILFSTNCFAQYQDNSSQLNLKMWDKSFFMVEFDGKFYGDETTFFQLDNINPGLHKISIFQYFGRYGQQRMILQGKINIEESVAVFAKINRVNEIVISRITPIYDDISYYEPNMVDYFQLSGTLNNIRYESEKLETAKQIVAVNGITADQIYKVLLLFNFESSRLEFAKFAYASCVDKNNYYIINQAFKFQSSIREMTEFALNFQSQNNNNNNRRKNNLHENHNQRNNQNNSDDDNFDPKGGDW